MNTNEPTTGEIVRALREDCSLLDDNTDKFVAADRLESQERELSGITGELERMTARAESAERERDAVVRCSECIHLDVMNSATVYAKCRKYGFTFFPFDADTRGTGCTNGERGQPQDGEGK